MKNPVTGRLKQFDVQLKNDVGQLAILCDVLSAQGVNIRSISTDSCGIIRIVTEDSATTEQVLNKANISFKKFNVLSLRLNDRPGELSKVSKMLSKNKVNVESVFLLDRDSTRKEALLAFKVDDLEKAEEVLKEWGGA